MSPYTLLKRFAAMALLMMVAGCASVHYEQGNTSLDDKELVFGRMILVRDGKIRSLSTFSTSFKIAPLESVGEPLLIVESMGEKGRFHWILKPGMQLLNIVLHEPSGDIVSLAFDVPDKPGAYYFGDLEMRGNKHFSAIGSANVRNVSISFSDHFQEERAELLRRNPSLAKGNIGRLQVFDLSKAEARAAFFRKVLDAAPTCCRRMRDFRFEKLVPGQTTSAEIVRGEGAFDFPTGRSYFRAFELPPYSAPYVIKLHSKGMSSGVPKRFRVFAPAAMLLDDSFTPIETTDPRGLRAIPSSAFPLRFAALEQTIPLSEAHSRARYLVVYTTDSLLEWAHLTSVPGVLLIPGGALPLGVPQLAEMVPWPTGKLDISLDSDASSR